MKNIIIFIMLIPIILLWFFTGCNKDKNPAETEKFGEISGTINFIGTWPSYGDVQVSIWTSWPPMGPPAAATNPLTPGTTMQTYKIEGLSKGTYLGLTIGWRDPVNPAGAKILGIYWEQSDSLGINDNGQVTVVPTTIEISNDHLIYTDLNIKANLDIAP